MSSPAPQLRMRRALTALPALEIPAGLTLRHFEANDMDAWITLLNRSGGLGEWTRSNAEPYFAADSRMPLEGAFFLLDGNIPVATSQLHLKPDGPFAPTPELGLVAVDPDYQGRRLSTVVCTATMHYAAATGHAEIYLLTDDWRLAAVRTYLKLGFAPWITDDSHPERWVQVQHTLEQNRR